MQNWKRIVGGCLVAGALALFGCGGSSGTTPPATAVGKFVDAPVAGLSYASGSQKGVTGADGSFTYEVGQKVKFTIGDIVLGEATAQALMTPINLSATTGAVATTPDVLARVQLLMSLSSTDPATGTITIPGATLLAAQGKSIDFTSSTDLAAKIATLPNPRNIIMPTVSEASTHFSGTLNKIFIASMVAGKTIYDGSNDGYYSNSYKADGTMTGSAPTTSGTPIENAGATWTITAEGKLQRTSSHGTTTITLASINTTESYWAVTDVGSSGDSGTMRMFFNSSTGLSQAQSYYNSVKTIVPTTTGFTTAMISGKTFTYLGTWNGSPVINTKAFSADGTYSFVTAYVSSPNTLLATDSGTWSIVNGQLISTLTASNAGDTLGTTTVTLVSSTSTTLTATANGETKVYTYVTPVTATGFTTAMLAGHTATFAFTMGATPMVFSATGNKVTLNNGTTGGWNITSGMLTVIFPTDALTFQIASGSGSYFNVIYTHAATPTEVEGPTAMTIL
ncbi:MAG: hypothetical protein HIU83_11040 [Proteobacteria bacterium]|nr:hypothetical protein [Pseudomonadota bacterium]